MTVSIPLHISNASQTFSEGSVAQRACISSRIRLTLSKPHIEDVVAPYAQLMFNTRYLHAELMIDVFMLHEDDLMRIAMSFFNYYEPHLADTVAEIAQKTEAAKVLVEAHIKDQNYEKWIEARLLEELQKAAQAQQALNVERVERATTLDWHVSALFCHVYAADVMHRNRYFIDFINSSSDVLDDFITSYFKNEEV